MIRIHSICLAVAAAATSHLCAASEPFPVVHHEPLTVRILDGVSGKPRAGQHIVLAGGYTDRDLALGLWQEGARTNASGEVRIPDVLANLPFLRVWVIKAKTCQAKGTPGRLLVDEIRNRGWSAGNTCGATVATAVPGTLVLFVRGGTAGAVETAAETTPDNAGTAQPPSAASETSATSPRTSDVSSAKSHDEPIDAGTAAAFAAYEHLLPPQF